MAMQTNGRIQSLTAKSSKPNKSMELRCAANETLCFRPRRSPRFVSSFDSPKAQLKPSSSSDDLEVLRYRGSASEFVEQNRRGGGGEMIAQTPRRSRRLQAASKILKNNDADFVRVVRNCRAKNAVREIKGGKGSKRANSSRVSEKKVSKRIVSSSPGKEVVIQRRWQQMVPLDILTSISDHLPMPDLIRFRSVCSSWHSAPSFRSNITKFVKYQPWLILHGFQNKKSDDGILIQLPSNFSCTLKLPILNGSLVLVSKLGWLLCQHGNHYFFYNPFTLEKFDLPDYQRPLKRETKQVATFSSPPNSEDCIIFVIRSEKLSEVEISWCRPFEKRWFSELLVIAGNNPLHTGEWPCAVYCSCEKDGSCKCKHRNKVLVWQSESWMRYDIDNRVLQSGQRLKVNLRNWWSDLVDRRLDDVLSNFVEKDSNISFAPFNSTRSRALNLIPFDYKVKNGINSVAEAASLKAFWIEPEFPWK